MPEPGREQGRAAAYIVHLGGALFSVITQWEPKNAPNIFTQIAEELWDSTLYIIKKQPCVLERKKSTRRKCRKKEKTACNEHA